MSLLRLMPLLFCLSEKILNEQAVNMNTNPVHISLI